MKVQELKSISSQVRRDIIRMVSAVKSGHIGGSLGCTDFLTCLYFRKLEEKVTRLEEELKILQENVQGE